ncbi:MAG: Ig-like domain-containing protein [Gemmatimonadaceae bacterium]|jgi:uncharacterized protein YjdB|nr:Ig-like domain-containing protein [Gemmatimonadaceae bacterium]
MSTLLRTTALVAAIALLAACGGGDSTPTQPPPPAPVGSVSVSLGAAQLVAGTTTTATAQLLSTTGATLAGCTVTWTSGNEAVATVSATGLVTGVSPGTVSITATSEGRSGSTTLTVTPVPVATITVALAQSSVTAGTSTVASATLRSGSGDVLSGRTITWSSSSTPVATINDAGVITTFAPGTTTITATSEGRTGSATLTVTPVPVANIVVTLAATSLQIGQTTTAQAVVRDANGNALTGRSVTWISSNTSVATVSQSGVVSALAVGTTEIRATSEGRIGSALLQVSASGAASVTLSPTAIIMLAGDLRFVVASVRDANGQVLSGRTVNWFTSDTTIVQGAVRGDTALITGLRAGSATVSVAVDGRTASIPVLVQAPTTNVCTLIAGASIIANDGRFLGRFSNRFDSESVLNEFGEFGSRFGANSTNNQFGTYGSQFSTLSPNNPFTSTPPRIVRNGTFIAFYTVNQSLTPRVAPAFALTCAFP